MDVKLKVAAAARMLTGAGCDPIDLTMQVSARSESGDDSFWITPLDYYDDVRPENLIRVGSDRRQLEGDGEQSRVVNIYAGIYAARPDVHAVIHTHQHFTSLLAAVGEVAELYNNRSILFFEDQAIFGDELTQAAGDGSSAAEALGDKTILLAKNHGLFVAAESVEAATVLTLSFTTAARLHIEAKQLGARPSYDPEAVDAATAATQRAALIARRDYQRSYLGRLWEANLHRLERTDPDLFG
jgi:L-fuculose-phosphate aldolase